MLISRDQLISKNSHFKTIKKIKWALAQYKNRKVGYLLKPIEFKQFYYFQLNGSRDTKIFVTVTHERQHKQFHVYIVIHKRLILQKSKHLFRNGTGSSCIKVFKKISSNLQYIIIAYVYPCTFDILFYSFLHEPGVLVPRAQSSVSISTCRIYLLCLISKLLIW